MRQLLQPLVRTRVDLSASAIAHDLEASKAMQGIDAEKLGVSVEVPHQTGVSHAH